MLQYPNHGPVGALPCPAAIRPKGQTISVDDSSAHYPTTTLQAAQYTLDTRNYPTITL